MNTQRIKNEQQANKQINEWLHSVSDGLQRPEALQEHSVAREKKLQHLGDLPERPVGPEEAAVAAPGSGAGALGVACINRNSVK